MKVKLLSLLITVSVFSNAQNATHLQIQGRKIVGTCGDSIVLKGINYAPYNWGFTVSENYFEQIALSKANSVRIVWYKNSSSSIYNNLAYLDSAFARCVRAKMIPILVLHDATCTGNMADVTALLLFYTTAAFKALEIKYRQHLIINIANEAGQYQWAANPATALTTYKNTYQNAIINLRSNGLQVPFMIDAPDCGTNSDAIVSVGSQILSSDVLSNTMFSVHGYWYGFANNNPTIMATKVQALYNSGLCIAFGEVANQQDDANPCQYNLAYTQLLGILKTNNIGWMAWGWYNDVCPLRQISNNGNANNLSAYGQVIVNDAATGLAATAVRPLQFSTNCGNSCAVTATVNTNPVVCFGAATGSATVTLSGVGAAATGKYSKDGAAAVSFSTNPFTVTGFSAGLHTISLTNIGTSNCTASTGSFTIAGPTSPIATSFSATACDSYTWQGTTYNTSGAKVKVLNSSKGCDSTVTLNLTIKNSSASTTTGNICSTTLPYLWNGIQCTSAGTYVAHLTNAVGCDSLATLILNVNTFAVGQITGPATSCPYAGNAPGNAQYNITSTAASRFMWSLPAGATLVSGQGTNSIMVHYSTTFSTGAISVVVSSNCGADVTKSITITKGLPVAPVITGPNNACSYIGSNIPVTYSLTPVANALTYRWTLPSNVTLVTASPDSQSVTLTFNANFATGTSTQRIIKAKSVSGCGNSADKSFLIFNTIPSILSNITGPSNACANNAPYTATYTIRQVANATAYIWTVPPVGAIITGHPAGTGVNDTVITVQFNASFPVSPDTAVDFVAVRATSPCGTSLPKKLYIIRKAPANTGAITGLTDVCNEMIGSTNNVGTPVTYTIRKVLDATSYNWTVPAGATITAHPGGAGVNDTIITVLFSASFPVTGGLVSVKAINPCFNGSTMSLYVKAIMPATPASITGPGDACISIINETDATYTIRKINLASAYSWSVINNTPAGAGSINITAHPGGNGVNDTIVKLKFNQGFTTGYLKVKSVRNCGVSIDRTMGIITKKLLTPPYISGDSTPCYNTTQTYIAAVVANATGYNWTVPVNAQILSGQGMEVMTVKYPDSLLFRNGNITAVATSVCGNSPAKYLPITKCIGGGKMPVAVLKNIETGLSIYPNPASGNFSLILNCTDKTSDVSVNITNEYGQVVYSRVLKHNNGKINVSMKSHIQTGVLIVNCKVGVETFIKKLVNYP